MTSPKAAAAEKKPLKTKITDLIGRVITCAIVLAIYVPVSWLWFQVLPKEHIFTAPWSFQFGMITGAVSMVCMLIAIPCIFIAIHSIHDKE